VSEPGRLLALDLGEARIGVAVSDPSRSIARPIGTLANRGRERALQAVAALVAEHDARGVIVGHPLDLSGNEGAAARRARRFAELLAAELPGIAVELHDERLSTVEAERRLAEAGLAASRRREAVDAAAAVVILQSHLDALALGRTRT
jgi:putative Holliday junction resolvase